MVLNAAVQMLREADELKEAISKFKSGTSMLQERSLWATQQQLQNIYQKVLVLDLDYALDKKVEQDLWNIGFKQQIEALQAISKDRKNPLRSEGQAMLSWVLQAAAGFYLCLLHQICTTFQLDLPFRRRASLLGWVEGWGAVGSGAAGAAPGAGLPAPAAARYICQHCLVHLGDLARYRHQMRVAHTFYRHALVVSVHSGQPYNQLALVWWRRGRRLAALYWHVRSLLVRAPFPPAAHNLARTLRSAVGSETKDTPVLPGINTSASGPTAVTSRRLDAHSYVTELIRALHYIHSGEDLDTASQLVELLNSSLITLVATDSFESMTLIKMLCVLIWLVHSTTEEFTIEPGTATEGEARAAALACELADGFPLALLLPSYAVEAPLERTLPALKVWLQWCVQHASAARAAALGPALARTLGLLRPGAGDAYRSLPLPEDEELYGFLPLEGALSRLQFPNHASWDTYAARVPSVPDDQLTQEVATCLLEEPELQKRVRAHRLIELGKDLADMRPELLSYTTEGDVTRFEAASVGGEQLSAALAQMSAAVGERGGGGGGGEDSGDDSDGDVIAVRPPIVISEADFREKVREKRAGILKPQGSLERAREERALLTQEDQINSSDEGSDDGGKCADRRESRKPRVNIAMAAIMRKQEETNKQVKFVTPPPTPESTTDGTESKEERPKVIQPKAIKSLANLPIGRKTGGILSLKDKSGYPHLVNADPEPKKDKEDKKEPKVNQPASQSFPKKVETSPTWPAEAQQAQTFTEGPRMTFQKNYGLQNAGIIYNPNYQPTVNNQGIRLPVVNPKEIDVRTAALQKRSSRQDLFQDKFNHNYQISGDKKNFLNDLPPRFANQYRYWQAAHENQFNDNKFRDDSFKPSSAQVNQTAYNQPRSSWMAPDYAAPAQPPPYWKPDFNFPPSMKPNFFVNNQTYQTAYPNQNFSSVPNTIVQKQPETQYPSTIGQPMQTLQSMVTSPSFSSSLTSYAYPPPVQYDATMYPQFNNMDYRMQKPPPTFDKDAIDLGFGNLVDMQKRGVNFNDPNADAGKLDQSKVGEGMPVEAPGNTYSLFSGAPNPGWSSAQNQPSQSLWSGPGPSPLERLLEQQKQTRPPQ